ncbi:MAG: fluoride efflux transporter FluC, partial [Mycobacteriales bacterium]
ERPAPRRDDDPDLPERGEPPLDAATLAAVALGGIVGALARYGLGRGFPTATGGFPATTLVINVAGSLLLGLLVGVTLRRATTPRLLRPALGTGAIGGFTTFSTFVVDADRLISTGHAGTAAGYLAATLVAGTVAAALGLAAAAYG